jgi:basic membrane lipoprotein Med (substrate-binding protein (PBP1-ABC) superfamily)
MVGPADPPAPEQREDKMMNHGILRGWRRLAAAAVGAVLLAGWGAVPAQSEALQVAAVLPFPANDLTWTQALHEGLSRLEQEGVIEYTYTENVPPADAERVLRRYAERRPDLIIAHSGTYRDAVFRIAAEFPDLKFAWPSFGTRDKGENLAAYDTPVWEAAYFAGIVAAHVTKTGHLGFVGGIALPGCRAIYNGFRAGAHSVNENLEITPVYVGDFADIAKAKALALSLADRGADIFSICGSGPARGAIEAARERGLFAIGYVYDMSPLAPDNVLGSLVWDGYKGMSQLIEDIRNGTFLPAKYYPGTAAEGITTFSLNAHIVDRLPAAAVAALEEATAQVLRGERQIPISFD